jgi:hypothetical protein
MSHNFTRIARGFEAKKLLDVQFVGDSRAATVIIRSIHSAGETDGSSRHLEIYKVPGR